MDGKGRGRTWWGGRWGGWGRAARAGVVVAAVGLAGCGAAESAPGPEAASRLAGAGDGGAPPICRAGEAAVDPDQVLVAAVEAMGSRPGGALRFGTVEARTQDFQSDRHYPPFFSSFDVQEVRYDPSTGAEHRSGRFVYPGMGPGSARESAVTDTTAYLVRDGVPVPVPQLFGQASDSRRLNPWAVVEDWARAPDVRATGECRFRDEWRTALERPGSRGADRLLLDRETGFPVALLRTEPHATWGQRSVAFVWSTWVRVGPGSYFPSASFRTDDGRVTLERTVGRAAVVPEAEAGLAELPDAPAMAPDPRLTRWTDDAPDTARVGDDAFLLTHWGYNEAVVAVGDTVYLLDATVAEARARQDSAWIARLFPDREHVAVVVTDVAWPHVGGVRFWVARGATILTHPVSVPFLEELVAREWTLEPDALQRARNEGREISPRIRGVGEATDLAEGALRLVPIGGVGSEGALMAWVPGADFLWAGDYVQLADRPTMYAEEVLAAARREGIRPGRVAAQHLPLTPWEKVVRVNLQGEGTP